ncbi:MAG: hypothetical protein QOF57_346 [Frankiaceae bacterium]|jgi:hypothetical protein|nr:hypothetical protein [Frankiaceae bacterium]
MTLTAPWRAGWLLPADGRPPVSRDDAAKAARDELGHPIYRNDQSWLDRALARIGRWFSGGAHDATSGATTSTSIWPALVVLAIVVILIGVIVWRGGKIQTNASRSQVLHFDAPMTAAAHRTRAASLAAAGEWREAVRERLRATVRELEERGLLDERPGRTATEIAAEAGAALPAVAADLAVATRTFADVWYGDRPATAATDAVMRAVDERVLGALRSRVGVS